MALADSVPGVSGGTIAFILGFYDKFIGSINDLIYERGKKRKEAFFYLVKLGIGWIIGMLAAVSVLSTAFETHIYFVSSLFIGFVIAAIPLVVHQEKESYKGHLGNIIFAVIGAAIVVGITLLNRTSFMSGIDLGSLNLPLAIYIFVAGMIAISAMFLPGISGSTILLIFGLYLPVITGVKELMHFNFSVFPSIIIFICGILAGILSVVKGIKVCLDKHRSKTMYLIFGLMLGSLYAIVMGPTTLKTPVAALSIKNFSFLAFIIGIAIVAVLQIVGSKRGMES